MGDIRCIDYTYHNSWLSQRVRHKLNQMDSVKGEMSSENSSRHKILFLVDVNEIGENIQALSMLLEEKNKKEKSLFNHAQIAIIVRSSSEKYTKSFIKRFLYLANDMGAELIGHGAIEILPHFQNFSKWAINGKTSAQKACENRIEDLIDRLDHYEILHKKELNLLVLHAGHHELSNTLMLWEMVRSQLLHRFPDALLIDELHVEEGQITDCYGCHFETCMYYALEKSCFYGGFIVEELFPKIEKADLVVWICPNYNDAISAKLMAVINRLTALYRTVSFRDKYILGIFVSGNSGNDSVARQLLGALNVNKGFRVLPHFALMALANDPGEIRAVEAIDQHVEDYVNTLSENLNKIFKKIN